MNSSNKDKQTSDRRHSRFQFSLRTLLLVVTGCGLLLSYWASTRPVPASEFLQVVENAPFAGIRDTHQIVGYTLDKIRGGNKTMHVLRQGGSSGRHPNGDGEVTLDALVVLPHRLHEKYFDEFHQSWLDLLKKTECTVESDNPLTEHAGGFVLTYTTKKKRGTLSVYCNPGGDQVHTYHGDGRVTDVPYKDDVLNVIVEVRETVR